jgi:GH18 family chitinase
MRIGLFLVTAVIVCGAQASEPPQILTNHLGYDPFGPKRAVIRGTAADDIQSFTVRTYPDEVLVYKGTTATGTGVDHWKNWQFWSLDFTDVQREGTYIIEAQDRDRTLRSFPFKIQKNILERFTISDVLFYFKGQRKSGLFDKADRNLAFQGSDRKPVDVHGGWYDASGDYGVHLSHLDFSSYFNPQQMPLAAFTIGKTLEILQARKDPNFRQIQIRLADELAYGADFLVRMKNPGGSFYETIDGYADNKRPEARRIVRTMAGGFSVRKKPTDQGAGGGDENGFWDVGIRNGGGFAIAALAMAARLGEGGEFDRAAYLKTAEDAWTFLQAHNGELLNNGKENIVDDYCALVAAAELYRTTKKPAYADAAESRASSLIARLTTSGSYRDYWRADDGDRPFFHAADAGAPVVALLDYYELAGKPMRERIRGAVRRSLEFELRVTSEVPNPFGLARQYVQSKTGERRTSFFYPHDSGTAPWWQGENARLSSLSAAVRLAAPLFAGDPAFQAKLQAFSLDQLNWILGLNPFDASMLQGTGRNNPEYVFFTSWEYKSAPGGICNGITSGYNDEHDIDLNVPYEVTGQDSDWRWAEQWIPHAAWYLLAAAAGHTEPPPGSKAIIGYVFPQNRVLAPDEVAAEKLTHINYAFANIRDGEIVEGFQHDAENFRILNSLKAKNPALKILVSVGGWTWSGGFSDVALTRESRKRFIDSAIAFLRRHSLDGLDIDWEYPAQSGYGNVNRPEDRENCTALLAEARAALDGAGAQDGKRYLLTMATQAADVWLVHTEMDKAQAYLDFVNLMAYDQFEATSSPITGHHAPLFTSPANPKADSAATSVSHYIAAGVPAAKIVLGVPFYGHAWGDVGPAEGGLYQPGKEPASHVYTSFDEIEKNLDGKNGFTRQWDDIAKAPFLYNPESRLWVSYEDEQSIRAKAKYVVDRGLGGMMFWQYTEDAEGKLLSAINRGLR